MAVARRLRRVTARPLPPAPHGSRALGLVLPAGALALWWSALRLGWVAPYQLPAPQAVLATALELLARGELQHHVAATLARLAAGLALGASTGVALGIGGGLFPVLRRMLDPTIHGLRAVPSLAWVPLFLMWFGIGERARVLLIALGAFLPVYLNAMAAVDGVDRRLVEVGRAYGLRRGEVVARIVLPAALPGVLTGLRAGLSLAWMFVVAAELIAASDGLGFLLTDGQATARPDLLIASLLVFAVLGRGSDALVAAAERRLLHWRDTLATAEGGGR